LQKISDYFYASHVRSETEMCKMPLTFLKQWELWQHLS